MKIRYIVLLLVWTFSIKGVFAQLVDEKDKHELTVFLMSSTRPISWESPRTLYKSTLKSYSKTIFTKGMRFLGHAVFSLKTDLLEDTLWMGIAPMDYKDFSHQLFVEKIGLGVLGYPFKSKIEEKDFLKENLILNAERSEVTFMRFQISRESAQQIIDFLNIFQGYVEEINGSPSNYYGGIFMPLYYGEGSGCTALCVAAMEAAGIVFDEETKNEWMVSVDLPMNLIGGEFNNDKKIALKRIKKTKSWYKGKGLENVDYVNFDIYDANHIFEWVNKRINSMSNITCSLSNSCKIKGISFDYTHIKADGFLLQQYRPNPNLFINKYFELLK